MNIPGKKAHWSRTLLAAVTLLLALLLAVQCISIFRAGMAGENFSENGARIRDIYSRSLVVEKLREIAWVLPLWLAALAIALLHSLRHPAGPVLPPRKRCALQEEKALPARSVLRIALLIAAIVLVAAGIFNGGMDDVLIKAINICTECIGLG